MRPKGPGAHRDPGRLRIAADGSTALTTRLRGRSGLLDGLGVLVWGVLDLQPAMERLIGAITERLPVDVFLPDVPAAACPGRRAASPAARGRGDAA